MVMEEVEGGMMVTIGCGISEYIDNFESKFEGKLFFQFSY